MSPHWLRSDARPFGARSVVVLTAPRSPPEAGEVLFFEDIDRYDRNMEVMYDAQTKPASGH
jgi:hypothetical protein